MKKWQYWKSSTVYTFIVSPIIIILTLKHRFLPHNIVFANPQFKYGGMEIDSKYEIHRPLENSPYFLDQILLKNTNPTKNNVKIVEKFMKDKKITYPIILKPEKGCVGFGVKKINSKKELENILQRVPVNYLAQEYCDYKEEFGVMFRKIPGKRRGEIVGITRKQIPWVCGDGKSTVKELIEKEPRYKYNKSNLFVRAKNLSYVPKKKEEYQIIVQGSHTYGSIFTDVSFKKTKELENVFNEINSSFTGFYFGRYDVKATSLKDFSLGKGIKVIEVNGCMSEPTHMYDDKYSLGVGIKEFYSTYNSVFTIAKKNKMKSKRRVSYMTIICELREFLKIKDKMMKTFD